MRAPTQAVIRPLVRLGGLRTTRAHLAVHRRPAFKAEAEAALGSVTLALAEQLGCELKACAQLLAFEVQPLKSLSNGSAFAIFQLGARGARALVEVERSFLVFLLGRLSGCATHQGPVLGLTPIEQAAFAYLCAVAVKAVRASPLEARFAPRLLDIALDRMDATSQLKVSERHVAVELELAVGGERGMARVMVPATALQGAALGVPVATLGPCAPQVLAACLPLVPSVGRVALDRAELSALRAGDVVVLGGVSLRGGQVLGSARLAGNHFSLFGEATEAGFALFRVVTPEVPVSPSQSGEQTVSAVQALEGILVDVEVELARLRLSLNELSAIRPGALLPLRMNAADPVLLKVGDRAVARAELVEIEGEVGARVLALLPERGEP